MAITQQMINEFMDKGNVIAVVGVSHKPKKFGYRIFFDLRNAGYKMYPVHKLGGEVEGITRYASLADLPEKPDVVDLVVPPSVGVEIVKECRDLGIDKVWMQPGSESAEAVRFCEENNIRVISNLCMMLEKKTVGGS